MGCSERGTTEKRGGASSISEMPRDVARKVDEAIREAKEAAKKAEEAARQAKEIAREAKEQHAEQ